MNSKCFKDTTNINNQPANDIFSSIVDAKCGYRFGKPVSYTTTKESENVDSLRENLWRFLENNWMEILDKKNR
ncbi:phage portal protein [bacterium]|nr:phage portal protein [bacterium]